jgi:hypothetical protein
MSNPFLTSAVNRGENLVRQGTQVPYNTSLERPQMVALNEPIPLDACMYTLVKTGPDVNPREVELLDATAIEVLVLWGSNVLHVSHVIPPHGFVVGEAQDKQATCDFFVPEEVLGVPRLSLVANNQTSAIVIPPGANGSVEFPGEPRMSLSDARLRAHPSSELPGAFELQLPLHGKARFQLGEFTFQFACVNAGRPCRKGFTAGLETEVFSFFGLSLAAVGSFVTAMAFLVPSENGIEDESFNADQVYVIRQYLKAAAEREAEALPTEQAANVDADNHEGGTGIRAKNEEGLMGDPTRRNTNGRYGVAGPANNPDPHISHQAALEEARHFGLIGMLNAGLAGDPNALTAPWGREDTLGRDELSARGNMWGDEINGSYGLNGLGLSGIGEGGGGRGEGIGLGTIGGLGNGAGLGRGQGFGLGNGGLGHGTHKVRVPLVRPDGQTLVSGRLPPEVIQRIVRQNYGRFRMCYEQGLSRNPNLQGRVQVRFVIGRDGAVSNVQRGDSDLPDSAVVGCVMGAYYGLSFPQPEGGIVTVAYPIMFQPG